MRRVLHLHLQCEHCTQPTRLMMRIKWACPKGQCDRRDVQSSKAGKIDAPYQLARNTYTIYIYILEMHTCIIVYTYAHTYIYIYEVSCARESLMLPSGLMKLSFSFRFRCLAAKWNFQQKLTSSRQILERQQMIRSQRRWNTLSDGAQLEINQITVSLWLYLDTYRNSWSKRTSYSN